MIHLRLSPNAPVSSGDVQPVMPAEWHIGFVTLGGTPSERRYQAACKDAIGSDVQQGAEFWFDSGTRLLKQVCLSVPEGNRSWAEFGREIMQSPNPQGLRFEGDSDFTLHDTEYRSFDAAGTALVTVSDTDWAGTRIIRVQIG